MHLIHTLTLPYAIIIDVHTRAKGYQHKNDILSVNKSCDFYDSL